MLKKLTLSTIVLSALLLNGCGGGGSSKSTIDIIKERNAIIIDHAVPKDVCESPEVHERFTQYYINANYYSMDNTINCAAFGRTQTSNIKTEYCREAAITAYPGSTEACVIAFDDFTTNSKSSQAVDADMIINLTNSLPVYK